MNRERCLRIIVVVLYTVMNVGIPVGDFKWNPHPKNSPAAHTASTGCRCTAESRAAGRCCCSKSSGKMGCCSTRVAKTETRSCCAKKSAAKPVVKAEAMSDEAPAWRGDCPCGPSDSPVLICTHPRILSDATERDVLVTCCAAPRAPVESPCGQRPLPFVPPPEHFLV